MQKRKKTRIVKNKWREDLESIKVFTIRTISYCGISINELPYQEWQKCKDLLLLIGKHLRNYVVEKQKKAICQLTDCYKDNVVTRICELCGNTVQCEDVYCTECGNKIIKN